MSDSSRLHAMDAVENLDKGWPPELDTLLGLADDPVVWDVFSARSNADSAHYTAKLRADMWPGCFSRRDMGAVRP